MSFADDARSNSRRLGACSQRVSVVNSAKTTHSPLAGEGWGEGVTKTSPPNARSLSRARSGFTLVEMLVAVGLTLLLMTMVVSVMSQVMEAVSTSRSTIEMSDRLRFARERIQKDLAGTTLFPNPPHKPESGEGYFEYIEGPMGPAAATKKIEPANGIYALDTDEVEPAAPPPPKMYPNLDFTGADNSANRYAVDTTVGDLDDILMFTSRAQDEPFVGRFNVATMIESRVAEIAYFIRGTTLYRRVLLVRPDLDYSGFKAGGFYNANDVSVRTENGPFNLTPNASTTNAVLIANSLGDLTKREHRYGHQPYRWPHDARIWWALGLPTLTECSDANWPFPWNASKIPGALPDPTGWTAGTIPPPQIIPSGSTLGTQLWTAGDLRATLTPSGTWDAWRNSIYWNELERAISPTSSPGNLKAYSSPGRISEDVLLTNVLSFDVKVWDPGAPLVDASGVVYQPGDASYLYVVNPANGVTWTAASYGAFVDLWGFRDLDANGDGVIQTPGEYALTQPTPNFLFGGNRGSAVVGSPGGATPPFLPAVYDTWSTHYEQDGIDQGGIGGAGADEGTNGLDDDNQNGVDDPGEQEAPPPYAYPLRAIQIKLRVFEPDSRQIREVTIVHEFLPQ